MLKDVQASQTESYVVLFIMAPWVDKMELYRLLCVIKKKFLWQRNA